MLMDTRSAKTKKRQRVQDVCRCKAYKFPHRLGSGCCVGNDDGPFCGACGMPCKAEARDVGIGSYEYWGSVGVDSRIVVESRCCDAHVFSDAELTIDFEGDN